MYNVNQELKVNVTGPASLFKKTRKYGSSLAKLLPRIIKADNWELEAKIETEVGGEKRIYDFNLDNERSDLFTEFKASESFDSQVERDFSQRIRSVIDWEVTREPTILRAGNRVMVPDYSFRKSDKEFYLEVVGFWTPEYLKKKIEKVKQVNTEKDLILAVNEELNCSKQDFGSQNEVFFYDRKIPLNPVVDRIKQLEQEIQENDLKVLGDKNIALNLSDDQVTDLGKIADKYEVSLSAIKQHVKQKQELEGYIVKDKYISQSIATEIKDRIEAQDEKNLTKINQILKEYDLPECFLDHIGYKVKWSSLSQRTIEKID